MAINDDPTCPNCGAYMYPGEDGRYHCNCTPAVRRYFQPDLTDRVAKLEQECKDLREEIRKLQNPEA